ncbi:D-alanine--poly(phosphoribitol) ligase subunit DltA [Secundilactobacillus kimchicus]|nr:D-alanine--poly(phosphoribitol) ligase subunit DltA [Secundilactobacillus kimchicus]
MLSNIVEAITKQAQAHPERIAYDYRGAQYTYRDVEDQSNKLANALDAANLTAGAPVLVYGGQSFQMLVSFLALAKTGHPYIPVDTESSTDRTRLIIETAQPALIIEVADLPFETPAKRIAYHRLMPILSDVTELNFTPDYDLDRAFYVIFTSGSTGRPKGVPISHANLLSFVNWVVDSDLLGPANSLLQPPFSFDLSVMATYPTLVSGGTLKVLPQANTKSFKDLFAMLSQLEVNDWVSTPTFAELCMVDPNFNASKYPTLRSFIFCGEELTVATAAALKKRFPEAKVINTYGPTEATVAITSVEITDEMIANDRRLPIGRVKPDTTVVVRPQVMTDEQGDEILSSGELMITGPSVAAGYLNAPEQTAKVFLKNADNTMTYATGDLGHFDHDLLYYEGRLDHQIKLNGYRIELEEVAFHLRQLPAVDKGVVVPEYGKDHRVKRLVAVVVLNASLKADSDVAMRIRHDLSTTLMPYMVPARILFRDELPVNGNGKVAVKQIAQEVNEA